MWTPIVTGNYGIYFNMDACFVNTKCHIFVSSLIFILNSLNKLYNMAFLLGVYAKTETTATAGGNAWLGPAYFSAHPRAHRNLRMFSTVPENTACELSEGKASGKQCFKIRVT